MAITNLERKIRFSNCTVQEYRELQNNYIQKALPILMEQSAFTTLLESNGNGDKYIMSKAQLTHEAEVMSKDGNYYIANFGKAILNFLSDTGKGFKDVLLAIDGILIAGGVVLTTCITLMIAIVLYAVTVLPAETIRQLLEDQNDRVWNQMGSSRNTGAEQRAYAFVSNNITNSVYKDGKVKDVRKIAKMVPLTESISEYMGVSEEIVKESNTELANYLSILKVLESRIETAESNDATIMESNLCWFGNLAPEDRVYNTTVPTLESVTTSEEDGTDLFMTLESIVKEPMLSGEGLLHGTVCIVTDACDKNSILEFFNCYKNTAKYEFTHENFSDIPLLKASGVVLEFVQKRCGDNAEMLESVQTLSEAMAELIDTAYEEVKEEAAAGGAPVVTACPSTTDTGFNPNPFSIGSLTPFPVAARKVGSILSDITNAETDEELTEALLNFERVSSIINEFYEVSGNDTEGFVIIESNVGRAARSAETKANQAFAKAAAKDRTGGVREAVKRTLDPMEKFIQKQYDELKEKDANERRNIILKGGVVPKVIRWIKRGIGIMVGSAVGTVIPAAAIVSGIVFIGFICTDKYLDGKERAKLLRELEDEIQIVNEKIDDSRGDDNKQNKYELMRIRNQLTRTSEKIRLGLKY